MSVYIFQGTFFEKKLNEGNANLIENSKRVNVLMTIDRQTG
jgi:hypothetical protein